MQPLKDYFHANAMVLCIAIGIVMGLAFSLAALQNNESATRAPGVQIHRGVVQTGPLTGS